MPPEITRRSLLLLRSIRISEQVKRAFIHHLDSLRFDADSLDNMMAQECPEITVPTEQSSIVMTIREEAGETVLEIRPHVTCATTLCSFTAMHDALRDMFKTVQDGYAGDEYELLNETDVEEYNRFITGLQVTDNALKSVLVDSAIITVTDLLDE